MSYSGEVIIKGTSTVIRLEKDLFRQHPEFSNVDVKADVIGPGKLLISVVDGSLLDDEDDPIVAAFLSFLENDISNNPASIIPLDPMLIARAKALTEDVGVIESELE
jgi:antitoxin PrlF